MKLVIDAYKTIYRSIIDPENQYANVTSIVPRTPEQVAKLLS